MTDVDPQMVPVPDLERAGRFGKWQDRIIAIASTMCADAVDGAEACKACVRVSYQVSQAWLKYFDTDSEMATRKQDAKNKTVLVALDQAYLVAKSVLDPDFSTAVEGYGAL